MGGALLGNFEKSINKEYSYVNKTAEKMPNIPKSK
jgi:hypothetical protein